MALNNFIPTVWSARLLENLRKTMVYGQAGIINRDYEGEIRAAGDSVKINSIGPVTVGSYTKNTDITAPETLTDAQLILQITQATFFNFQIDDIDKAQQTPKLMEAAMREAAYSLADTADQFVAATMGAGVLAGNQIGTQAAPKTDLGTAGKAYDYLIEMGVKLDESNIPRTGRWAVVPPWYYALLVKDDRFIKQGTPAADAVVRNALVGEAAGFTITQSNNTPLVSSVYKIITGYPGATTLADQINEVEGYRPEKRFADAMKGLYTYGAKVLRPSGLAMLFANRA